MTVDPNYYVVNMQESFSMSGQCAFLKTYSLPGFRLQGQASLQTNHDVGAPILLRAVSSWHGRLPSFDSFFVDRALGEKAIFSLVTLVDLTDGTPVEYLIGQPQKDSQGIEVTLALTPVAPLALNHAYRLTINPGDQQSFVPCHTYGLSQTRLTAPESVDFFTYSRPMVGKAMIAYKSGTSGYFAFNFTEPLSDLDAYPSATMTVDGVPYSGCMMPYACSGSLAAQPTELRLDSTILPTTFSIIVLRIPHAVKSINGGTILDGTRDNPHATIDGDVAVFTFNVADFVWTMPNAVRTWSN
jgi:hypothetical protein